MTYEEIISEVNSGARFTVSFEKRTLRLNRKPIDLSGCQVHPRFINEPVMRRIERLYKLYKHSVPSERSELHRRCYFKALPEEELSDSDMMYGDSREVARLRLELYVLLCILDGTLTWHEEWGTWFWQSPQDKDLIILRQWVEPQQAPAKEAQEGL